MWGPPRCALRATLLDCGLSSVRLLLFQLRSESSGAVDGARQTSARPGMLWRPSWHKPRPPGLEIGQHHCGGGSGGSACISPVQGPLLCLQIHSHQDVLHILIKVPPLAGRASAGWLRSELQGRGGVKHSIPPRTPLWRTPWLPPRRRVRSGSRRGRELGGRRAGGRRMQGWPRGGSGMGEGFR